MDDDFRYVKHESYVEGIYTGERTYEALARIIENGLPICQDLKISKIMLDVTGATGKWIDIDRYLMGKKTADYFRAPYKIFVLEKKKHINKFTETVANIRGVNILITHDKKEGMDWLLN